MTARTGDRTADIDETADLLSLLDDPTRLEMLVTLGDATHPRGTEAFAFSDFRAAVDVTDSGRFNYHLDQLRGTFIEETENGYRPTYPGLVLYMLIRSGALTTAESRPPADTEIACVACDEAVEASYDAQLLRLQCPGCETLYTRIHVPPGCVEGTEGPHRFRAAIQYTFREVLPLRHGVCPNCGGSAEHDVLEPTDRRREIEQPSIVYSCQECDYWMQTGFGMPTALAPSVRSVFQEHGVDLLSGRTNQILQFMLPNALTVIARNPWTVEMQVSLNGETLSIEVDETLTVTDVSPIKS